MQPKTKATLNEMAGRWRERETKILFETHYVTAQYQGGAI